MSNAPFEPLPYLPQSVRVEFDADTNTWLVIDTDGSIYSGRSTYGEAVKRANVRKGVVKAAVTRRLNKAIAYRNERRQSKCEANNVTWEYLRQELSEAEADAWLGLD